MFRNVFFFCCFVLVLTASCQKAPKTHTDTEYRYKVDSAVQEAVPQLQLQAEEDLDRRMSIEMPPLADSLSKK